MTYKDVTMSREGMRALLLLVGRCEVVDCLGRCGLERWFRGADGVLGVNSGLLPVLAGVTA